MTTPTSKLLATLALLARSRRSPEIAEYLELGATVIDATADDHEKILELNAEIQRMVDTGREPNDDERKAVRDRRHDLAAQIASLPSEPARPPQGSDDLPIG